MTDENQCRNRRLRLSQETVAIVTVGVKQAECRGLRDDDRSNVEAFQILRLRVLKTAAVVTRNTRVVAVRLSSACPEQAVFRLLVQRLTAG